MPVNISDLVRLAEKQAMLSRKPNTKVGAVLTDADNNVLLSACNDYIHPLYCDIALESDAIRKYYSEHAERRLIYLAIRSGITDFRDKIMAITHFPCCDCARAIILVGLKTLVIGNWHTLDHGFLNNWRDNMVVSKRMLESNSITIHYDRA